MVRFFISMSVLCRYELMQFRKKQNANLPSIFFTQSPIEDITTL